jgi:sugar lactone lactonase YvrE
MMRTLVLALASVTMLVALCRSLPLTAAFQEPAPGAIVTVAGIGASGYSGDGGHAVDARFGGLHGLGFDRAGQLYVLDSARNVVRRIAPDGVIATVVGTGKAGFGGDNAPASAATLNGPLDIAFDSAGNLFIADMNRIRKVTPEGTITTVAGPGNPSSIGDHGPATEAFLSRPLGLAVDREENLYLSEFGTNANRVRRVTPDGTITTVAGTGKAGFSGDGGPAAQAQISVPIGVATDAQGNLYIADAGNRRVRKVDANGIITTVIGGGTKTPPEAEGGPALAVALQFPHSIAVDTLGNLFLSDGCSHRVWKVTPDGTLTAVAGGGPEGVADRAGYTGDGGPATDARLVGPLALAIDAGGDLYLVDGAYNEPCGRPNNERVLKVSGVAAPGLIAGRPFPR